MWINCLDPNVCSLTKKALNDMIRKDLLNTSLLKQHHKRNSKVSLVPKTMILVITTKVTLFIIGIITTLIRSIQVFMALTKVTILLIIK